MASPSMVSSSNRGAGSPMSARPAACARCWPSRFAMAGTATSGPQSRAPQYMLFTQFMTPAGSRRRRQLGAARYRLALVFHDEHQNFGGRRLAGVGGYRVHVGGIFIESLAGLQMFRRTARDLHDQLALEHIHEDLGVMPVRQ